MKKVTIICLLLIPLFVEGQDGNKFGIKFSGFVKSDLFYDTRQTETIREGHFLLYPLKVNYDKDSADANGHSSFNILSIQTRLTGSITAPDALGAKTSGQLEAEFFGTSNADINGFRLRHAWVKLNWKSTELMIGQTWHPMFMTHCYPDVVSFNTGAPFQPFARNPQIRLTQKIGHFNLLAAIMAQRDFASTGPEGVSSKYLRNAGIPDMHLQIYFRKTNDEKQHELVAGIGGGYKTIKPRLITGAQYKTNQKISGLSGLAFIKTKVKNFTWKLEGVYGQNIFDLTMLGGYAIRHDTNSDNQAIDELLYTSLDVYSVWTEFMFNLKSWQFGVFGGYTKNLGSLYNISDWENASSYFARGRDIDYIYRVSPRIVFNAGKVRLALEGEYTFAMYGAGNNSLGELSGLKGACNFRALLGVYYFF